MKTMIEILQDLDNNNESNCTSMTTKEIQIAITELHNLGLKVYTEGSTIKKGRK